jgi:hypothetical protein
MAAKPPAYIEYPASCSKSGIAHFAAHMGMRNSKTFDGHAPGALEFVTFAGRLDKATGFYKGVLKFLPVAPNAEVARIDFESVLFKNPTPVAPVEESE